MLNNLIVCVWPAICRWPAKAVLLLLPVLACGALVTGCTQDPKPSAHEFVEWVQVDGSCKEDHVTQAGHYSGELVHWRNKATGVSSRYGSVENWDSASPEEMLAKIQHPDRYHPPDTIGFEDIAASDFQSQTFVLHGISNFLQDEQSRDPRYAATCTLAVQRRIDHPIQLLVHLPGDPVSNSHREGAYPTMDACQADATRRARPDVRFTCEAQP